MGIHGLNGLARGPGQVRVVLVNLVDNVPAEQRRVALRKLHNRAPLLHVGGLVGVKKVLEVHQHFDVVAGGVVEVGRDGGVVAVLIAVAERRVEATGRGSGVVEASPILGSEGLRRVPCLVDLLSQE